MKRLLCAVIGLCLPLACGMAQAALDLSGDITASSTLADPENTTHYAPAKAFDDNPRTIWSEGASGDGVGETIAINFGQPILADEVRVMPGFFNPTWWGKNGRVRRATLYFDDWEMDVTFRDVMKIQPCQLPKALSFERFTLRIDAVYPGTHYGDTCISEIQFFINGKRIPIDTHLLDRKLGEAP